MFEDKAYPTILIISKVPVGADCVILPAIVDRYKAPPIVQDQDVFSTYPLNNIPLEGASPKAIATSPVAEDAASASVIDQNEAEEKK